MVTAGPVPIAARASNECDGEGFNRTLPIRSAIGVAANMQAFSFFRCEPAHTKAAEGQFSALAWRSGL